jgi:hypothetical protein
MSKRHRFRASSPSPTADDHGVPRVVAMSLAADLAAAVRAGPREHQDLVDAALYVGQWLADQGLPGRWDRVRPAAVLRGLDFLPRPERERFLFSLVGLLGHGALTGRIPPAAAQQSIDEAAAQSTEEPVRAFARATSAQLGALLAS